MRSLSLTYLRALLSAPTEIKALSRKAAKLKGRHDELAELLREQKSLLASYRQELGQVRREIKHAARDTEHGDQRLHKRLDLLLRRLDRLPDHIETRFQRANQVSLKGMLNAPYSGLAADHPYASSLTMHEFGLYSQNGEDGALLYIFSKIGMTNRTFVEISPGDGRICNSANLSIHYGWNGLLVDGSEKNMATARAFYADLLRDDASRLKFHAAMVSVENVNEIVAANGIEGEIDLLSIDIDGNDFWVWKALDQVRPRVVVIEYNASFGPDRAVTIPYDPWFVRKVSHPSKLFYGASVAALTRLARERGYALVGCDSNGVNVFFVRDDLAAGRLSALDPHEAYFPAHRRGQSMTLDEQLAETEAMDLVTIA